MDHRAGARERVSAYRALSSESRVQILHVLQQAGAALPVDTIAAGVGLHLNTTREHLDRLIASGFVERNAEHRGTRGRPRMLYAAVDRAGAATMDTRALEHLTRTLVAGYGRAMASPAEAAEAAGHRWGTELAEQPVAPRAEAVPEAEAGTEVEAVPEAQAGAETEAVPEPTPEKRAATTEPVAPTASSGPPPQDRWRQLAALEGHFEDLGFDPEADPHTLEVHLHRCPFRELAAARTEVVCSVHLGLARGVLAQQGGPLRAERLEPFVGPSHCVLHLTEA